MLLYTLTLAAILCGALGATLERVVGGSPTTIDKHPHQVAIEHPEGYFCGGSIISKQWVLTAAHCVSSPATVLQVRSGSTYMKKGGNMHRVSAGIKHSNFVANEKIVIYDIGLLKVIEPFDFGKNVQAISMATVTPAANTPVVTTGWGRIYGGGPPSQQLLEVQINIKDGSVCKRPYPFFTDHMVCAGVPQGGKGSCNGDSGGPLIAGGKLIGVVSFGVSVCAAKGYPSVYTDVAYFRSWITSNTGV